MNANDFFKEYSIEIINKRTRISPISLKYIKNKEFKKIPKVKFIGFIRKIEKEFKIDLSEFIEEYNQATNFKETQNHDIKLEEPKKHNTLILFILALILFLLGAYLLYNKYNSKKTQNLNEINKTAFFLNIENNKLNETTPETYEDVPDLTAQKTNKTKKTTFKDYNETIIKQTPTGQNIIIGHFRESNHTDDNTSNIPQKIKIKTDKKLWFRAVNLDNNKTFEYIINSYKTLIGPNWYVKFGHGNITINYGNQTINPQTKKIIRILFKNGKVEYLKKPNRYEK